MKHLLFPLIFAILLPLFAMAQSVPVSFTGRDANNHWVQLDRVVITNQTKGWTETIIWPDTTLTMQNGTGIYDVETMCTSSLQLSQNNPNPFNGTTDVLLTVADAGAVTLEITDVNGWAVVPATDISTIVRANNHSPQHQFRISLSTAGTYVLTARQNGKTASIKMMNNGGGKDNGMEYVRDIVKTTHALSPQALSPQASPQQPKSGTRGNTTNPFNIGDQMEYIGYATINGEECESQHVTQAQEVSETFLLQFAEAQASLDGQPCPGTPTVTDIDGNVYNTVQIGNQCWMRENVRTTHYADSTAIPAGDSISYTEPYRYAPNNNENNISIYGYLYNWAAVMHGASASTANPSGVQGICPTGWHVPSDAEWTQLTNYVSSQSEYVCGSNNVSIAKSLAATTGWQSSSNACSVGNVQSNNNATGFSVVPAGNYYSNNAYGAFGYYAHFWNTTEYGSNASIRFFGCYNTDVVINRDNKYVGYSVRCLKD